MHGFSPVDGFVELNECMAEMIKYIANEPSVGLFYAQQHTQNAVPNLITLRNNVVNKSRETALHTEDSEDSISMIRSMKECGFSIADEMIRDIKESVSIMSKKQPRRGLIQNARSDFSTETMKYWGPSSWGRSGVYVQQDSESSGYFSNVCKAAREKATKFKWPQLDSKELIQTKDSNPLSTSKPPLSVASGASGCSSLPDMEAEELPVSSQVSNESQEQHDISLPPTNLLSEDFDDFKADKEAKLQEWLEGTGNLNNVRRASDAKSI